MASTVMQDPRSTQARSAWIAGLTEACTKITAILNMGTSHLEDLQLVEERPTDDDKCRIYIAPLGSKLWLQSPEPVVKLNGNIITKDYYGFSIDYLGGSIVFEDELNRPAEGDKITVTVDYINTESNAMTSVLEKLKELEDKAAKNYKGYYGTASDLEAADVAGVPGDYVIIEDLNEIWVWNDKEKKFVSTYKVPDLSPYYTKVEMDDLLEQKEDFIRAQGDTNASDAFYWGGRKTWVDLYQKVRETALSGVVFTDETKILETDSILTALGKLQGQINAKIHDILGTGEPTDATDGRVGQEYINTSNGDKYHLTTITTDGKYIWEKYANVSSVLNVPGGATAKLTGDFGTPPYEFEFSEDTDTHVNSFNGRTGAVKPQNGDYSAEQVSFTPGSTGMKSKDVDSAIKELFQSGSEGKALIASAITAKGVETSADALFQTMSENIRNIETNKSIYYNVSKNNNTVFNPSTGIFTFPKLLNNFSFALNYTSGSAKEGIGYLYIKNNGYFIAQSNNSRIFIIEMPLSDNSGNSFIIKDFWESSYTFNNIVLHTFN